MTRPRIHLLVDIVLFLLAWSLFATGLLMAFVLPPRSGGATVWGLTRHAWGSVHLYLALATAALIVLHLALNWDWVCSVVAKLLGTGTSRRGRLIGAGLGLALLVGATSGLLLWASASVETSPGGGHGMHARVVPGR